MIAIHAFLAILWLVWLTTHLVNSASWHRLSNWSALTLWLMSWDWSWLTTIAARIVHDDYSVNVCRLLYRVWWLRRVTLAKHLSWCKGLISLGGDVGIIVQLRACDVYVPVYSCRYRSVFLTETSLSDVVWTECHMMRDFRTSPSNYWRVDWFRMA